ncbi:MAG: hypothetical protein L6R41_003839 [Letrouitia leprolyta]|nr:MAG: hypothetical protein L6R41_003839 [Letrouitia leprolyta]
MGSMDSFDGWQRGIGPDTDLTVLLKNSPDSQSQVYGHALQLLESMRVSPSCNRLAASALIHSCQSIDGSSIDTEESLEDLKSVYAAQLAICELTDAGSKPPGPCEPFSPNKDFQLGRKLSHDANRHGGMPDALKKKLGLCLQSLESRPQHWTSYSNNRQNAVVMCQAARMHIEKDDLIKLHKNMVDTTSGADAALAQAVAAANEAMARQAQFGKEVNLFQQQVVRDLESSQTETRSYLGYLMKDLDSSLQGILKHFLTKLTNMGNEVSNVEEALRSSAAKANNLRSNIGKVFQQAVEGSVELAATQAKQWDTASASAAELQDSLQSLREQEVHSLLGAFDSINTQIVSHSQMTNENDPNVVQRASNELVAVMYSSQQEMDQRLTKLDKSFTSLESTAAALHATQNADAEAQIRLHEQVQVELQTAQRLLADITASTVALQATVNDTRSKVTDMVAFGGLTNKIMDWGWSLIIFCVLYHLHPGATHDVLLHLFQWTSIVHKTASFNDFIQYAGLLNLT